MHLFKRGINTVLVLQHKSQRLVICNLHLPGHLTFKYVFEAMLLDQRRIMLNKLKD